MLFNLAILNDNNKHVTVQTGPRYHKRGKLEIEFHYVILYTFLMDIGCGYRTENQV